MAYKIGLSKFARIIADMGGEVEEAAIRGLQSAAYKLEGMIPQSIQDSKPRPPKWNSVLFNSHFTTPTKRGAIVGVDAPHAPFMEYGVRPFSGGRVPPAMPLADWAYGKDLIDVPLTQDDFDEYLSRQKMGSKDALSLEGEDRELQREIDNAIRIVLGVVRKIGREGIEPRFFFKRAIAKFGRQKIVEEEIQSELSKIGIMG